MIEELPAAMFRVNNSARRAMRIYVLAFRGGRLVVPQGWQLIGCGRAPTAMMMAMIFAIMLEKSEH